MNGAGAAGARRTLMAGCGHSLGRWVADDTWLKRILTARSGFVRMYFETRYLRPDPWRLATSAYERERAERTLGLLGTRRYPRALEVGCGEGTFTARLLERCDRITAVDFSALAIARACRRFSSDPRVEVRRLDVLTAAPGGAFDLVVCAELFYYMSRAQFERVIPRVVHWIAPGGDLCLVHGTSVHDGSGRGGDLAWMAFRRAREPRFSEGVHCGLPAGGATAEGGRTSAGQIHDRFCRIPDLAVVQDSWFPRYRLTLLRRTASPPSSGRRGEGSPHG